MIEIASPIEVHRLVVGSSSSDWFEGNEESARMTPVALWSYRFNHIWINHQGRPKVEIGSLADSFIAT